MTSGIDRILFNPSVKPTDTVGVDTSFQRMAAPVNTAPAIQAPTPVAPPPRPADETGNATALVAALSSFGGVAKAFLDQRDDDQKQAAIVSGQFAAMSNTQSTWADAVRADPSLASESPWFKKAFTESIVGTAVSKRAGELHAEYATSAIANSTDVNAIQQWYLERMQGTLAQYTDTDSRKAALEVARAQAERFAAAHAKNATANLLIQADKAGSQGFSETLNTHSASPGVVPLDSRGEVALQGVTPAQRAFLLATASGESPGYNVRFGGAEGAKSFDINGPHPGIGETIHFGSHQGKKSTASGKYQFIIGTWKGIWDGANPAMTPENQDKAALMLAQRDYMQRTGRDLWKDIDERGFTRDIQAALAPTWESFHGKQDRRAALFNQQLQKGGGKVPGNPGAEPDFDTAQTTLYTQRDRLLAGGQSIDKVNGNLVQSVINKAVELGDPTYLKMLDYRDSKGMVLSQDPTVQKQIQVTRDHISTQSVTRDNQRRVLEDRQKAAKLEKYKSVAFIAMEEGYLSGKPKAFTSETLIEAAKYDISLAEKMKAMNKTLDEVNKTEDPIRVARVMDRLYNGNLAPADVPDLIANGDIKDQSTIKMVYEQARQNRTQGHLNSSVFKDSMTEIDRILRDPNNFVFERAVLATEIKGETRRAYDKFMTENPKAGPSEQANFLEATYKTLIGDRADVDAWKAQKKAQAVTPGVATGGSTPAPGTSPPAPAAAPKAEPAKPGMSKPAEPAPFVPPSKDVDTNTTFVFGSAQELEGAFQLWRTKPTVPGPFNYWLKAQGITDQAQAIRWYQKQKALASTKR